MVYLVKTVSFLHFIIIAAILQLTMARPGQFQEYGNQFQEDKCKKNDQGVIEVCQRCAKQTKSPIVYPMCCQNEEDAYNWCDKYINYGKKSK